MGRSLSFFIVLLLTGSGVAFAQVRPVRIAPEFQLTLDASGVLGRRFNPEGFFDPYGAPMFQVRTQARLSFGDGSMLLRLTLPDDVPEWTFRADAKVFFLQLQELYIRDGGPNGRARRILGGLGGHINLLNRSTQLALGAGVASLNWNRGHGEQDRFGFYAGGSITLRIRKFEGQLWVAYIVTQPNNWDIAQTSPSTSPRTIKADVWNTLEGSLLARAQASLEAFRLGPTQVRALVGLDLQQFPDGTEFLAHIGVQTRWGP